MLAALRWVSLPPFAHTVLGGALSFIMVFRTNTAYSRWWEARLMWGQVVITSRTMASQAAAMLEPDARRTLISELLTFSLVLKNHLRDEPTEVKELYTAASLRPTDDVALSDFLKASNPPNDSILEAMAYWQCQ